VWLKPTLNLEGEAFTISPAVAKRRLTTRSVDGDENTLHTSRTCPADGRKSRPQPPYPGPPPRPPKRRAAELFVPSLAVIVVFGFCFNQSYARSQTLRWPDDPNAAPHSPPQPGQHSPLHNHPNHHCANSSNPRATKLNPTHANPWQPSPPHSRSPENA